MMVPSAGTFSPGPTWMMSPRWTRSTPMRSSAATLPALSSVTSSASLGCSDSSFARAASGHKGKRAGRVRTRALERGRAGRGRTRAGAG